MNKQKENKGDQKLFKQKEWIDNKELHGNDELILNHSIMVKAQERILDNFKPKNRVAFVSLCTSTRPYSKSRKWKKFITEFKNVDYIISSNAGVIPLEYENSYPYPIYDAHGEKEYDDMYIIYTTRNLMRFFIIKSYEYVVFNFRPTLRNSKAGKFAGKYLKEKKHIKDYVVAPNDFIYSKAHKSGFDKIGLRMFPDLHPIILTDLHYYINKFNNDERL